MSSGCNNKRHGIGRRSEMYKVVIYVVSSLLALVINIVVAPVYIVKKSFFHSCLESGSSRLQESRSGWKRTKKEN